jgi:hypothetical protein
MTTTTNTTKLTYAVALEQAIACEALSAEVREKLEALLNQQNKKSNTERKPTKVQEANEGVKEAMLSIMREHGAPATVTEVFNLLPEGMASSTQKVSALMRQLLLEGKVVKTIEKRVSYFSAV